MGSSRTAIVHDVEIMTVNIGSVFEVGDTEKVVPRAAVLALQREYPFFYGNEGDSLAFNVFRLPLLKTNLYENVNTETVNMDPCLTVNHLRIVGVSNSAHVQIGSAKTVNSEARVLNIRHFFRNPYETQ